MKDEYTFDFLELGEEHSERELERALIARIEAFLRVMDGIFAFLVSQYRLEMDGAAYLLEPTVTGSSAYRTSSAP